MLEELETFLAVAECRNFTKAAQKRNLSQPPVSVQIKKLEDYFGASLIERNLRHKSIAFTQAGRLLVQSAKKICSEIEYARAAIGDLQGKIEGTLRIGASQTIGEYFLPEYLGRFTKIYNKVEPEIIIANTRRILELLSDGEIDVGLVEGEVYEDGIKADAFYNDKLVIIMGNKADESLQECRWVIREEGSASRSQWESFIKNNNIRINRKPIIFNTNFAVKEAVKNNLGCALISEHIAEQAADKGEVKIKKAAGSERKFYCLTISGRQERRAVSILKRDLLLNFTENKGINNKNEDFAEKSKK